MNILIIGSGAREHAIARALAHSPQKPTIFCFGSGLNPGIKELTKQYQVGNITDTPAITCEATSWNIDFAIIGPEAPLEAGVVDALSSVKIPSVGPTRQLAQIETSKSFTRNLLVEYGHSSVCPRFRHFSTMEEVQEFLQELGEGNYVVKADGLMGGKGVKVAGDHLHSIDEALAYCEELIKQLQKDTEPFQKGSVPSKPAFVIEGKLIGQEFSLMSFSDGRHLVHMPPVQDHKRAFVGDTGPNTGGMGSYSDANHLLPFLHKEDVEIAQNTNQKTIEALYNKFGKPYKGILYGGFMLTKNGVKLIEYNARFGDPEAMNVLTLLKSDFVEICKGILECTLNKKNVQFTHKATICKYAVPKGYPDNPVKGKKIDISKVRNKDQLYFGAVDALEDGLYETGSRAVAIIGIGDTLEEAEKQAEEEIKRVKGPLFHREDIGTAALIKKRVEMVKNLKCKMQKSK